MDTLRDSRHTRSSFAPVLAGRVTAAAEVTLAGVVQELPAGEETPYKS